MMPNGTNVEEFSNRTDYLAHLQRLAQECQTEPEEPSAQEQTAQQLVMLADALERLALEVAEMRSLQDSSAAAVLGLERRVATLEQSTPSPQSWRDLIQGIRSIREVVASQAAVRQSR